MKGNMGLAKAGFHRVLFEAAKTQIQIFNANTSIMKRNILIITVIAAAVMELIDTSIVNVALSHMSGNLGATLEDTSWVITAYAIANVIIIPITSFLAAKLGRRNYYIGSVILFTVFSSLFCPRPT